MEFITFSYNMNSVSMVCHIWKKLIITINIGCRFVKTQRILMIQVDIGGHPPIPTGSLSLFFVHHVILYYFVVVSSTLLGLYEVAHILQVDTGGLSPNPTGLFCMFSCQHILLYLQGRFGVLNNFFLDHHNQIVDRVKV